MVYHLAKGVQVRKEDWGLLFYSQGENKIYFAKSGDLLQPIHSDDTFKLAINHSEKSNSSANSAKSIEESIQKLIASLIERGIVVRESQCC